MLARALDLLVPPACAACGLPGGRLCAACRGALRPLPAPCCAGCGHPVPIPVERCPACRPALVWARQAVLYAGPAPRLVAALKDGRRRALARVIADLLAAALPPPAGAVLVPVPLGAGRLAQRGFNQSLLIAEALGRRWGLPVEDALERVREEAPQRGASADARARQAAGAFALRPGRPAPPVACLVDDVHTTGATLAACARPLRRGGATWVGAVAFARAPDPRMPAPPG
jgi:ComF family protein